MSIAALQRYTVLAMASAVLLALGSGWAAGCPFLGCAAALGVLSMHALVLGVEFVLMWQVEPRATRPRVSELIGAWWTEAALTPRVFCWRQPFRELAIADRLPNLLQSDAGRGVLLVHGLFCNRAFWNPWMKLLASRGHHFIAINLEPAFAAIDDDFASEIDSAVRRLTEASGGANPVIVAHSMGGLAVRHWLRRDAAESRVHRIITIGTPHQGTWLARFGTTHSARQMAQQSPWIQGLAAGESSVVRSLFTCFYGDCDNVVFPSSSARLHGADNRLIEGTAHVALAFHPAIFAETLRWLEPDRETRQYARSTGRRSDASKSPSVDTRR